MRYVVSIKYDGSKFFGSQKQKNQVTVLGEIERVISSICNEEVKVVGSSRTDKGVHADDFVFHFDSSKVFEVDKLRNSLNKMLMPNIYVNSVQKASDLFHARYSVKRKKYIYKINVGSFEPTQNDYILQYNKSIDIELMKKVSKIISGKHDFSSFTSDKANKDYIRDVKIDIEKREDYVYIYFESKGFLRYMIRNIVGLMLDINEGKKKIEDIKVIFESRDRRFLGKPASSSGLYLNSVQY